MKTAGIIAEYNPFHRGHAYHIAQTRAQGFDCIVCVMSGHFTQRGDVAVASKWARAAMALRHGADLVVELPLTFALAPAERFARGGVALLHALGCVDALSFGSETGRLEPLLEVAALLESGGPDGDIRRFLTQGISYAKAREQAVRSQLGAAAECLTQPNDTLGIEYLRALSSLHCVMRPLVIPRRGARHDEQGERDGFRSASHLRTLWQQGAFTPEHLSEESREILLTEHRCGRFPVFCSGLEPALLGLLRAAERGRYDALPDLSEGLENRLWRAVRQGRSLDEIHDLARAKRYPLARIRRLCLYLALGISAQDWIAQPPYLRLLGMNRRGSEFLRLAKRTAQLPLISGTGDVASLDAAAQRQYTLECQATDLYALACPRPMPCGSDQRHRLVKID